MVLMYILNAKVLHVAPSELLMQNQMEQVSRSKIVWQMSEEERDAEIFFKVDHLIVTTDFSCLISFIFSLGWVVRGKIGILKCVPMDNASGLPGLT